MISLDKREEVSNSFNWDSRARFLAFNWFNSDCMRMDSLQLVTE